MPRWVRICLAMLLVPVCLAITESLFWTLRAGSDAQNVWVPLLGGMACWAVVYLMLPKPMWVYVVGHELTHALSTWLCGGKVKKIRCSSRGGHVVVSKTNFFIVLTPYFVPFYSVCLVLLFGVGQRIWGWTDFRPWFHLLLGATYCFHLTLTTHILRTEQSDIASQGQFFSAIVIWLGNVTVLLVGIVLLTEQVSFALAFRWCVEGFERVFLRLGSLF